MRVSYSPGYYATIPNEHIFPMKKFQGLHSFLLERERIVIERITQNEFPLFLLLSGGYAPTLKETVVAHAQMYEVAKEMGF